MTGVSKEELEEVLTKALGSPPDTIPAAVHDTHHKFVQLQMEKDERRQKRWEKAQQSVIGTIVTVLTGAILWVGKVVFDYVTHNGGNH